MDLPGIGQVSVGRGNDTMDAPGGEDAGQNLTGAARPGRGGAHGAGGQREEPRGIYRKIRIKVVSCRVARRTPRGRASGTWG